MNLSLVPRKKNRNHPSLNKVFNRWESKVREENDLGPLHRCEGSLSQTELSTFMHPVSHSPTIHSFLSATMDPKFQAIIERVKVDILTPTQEADNETQLREVSRSFVSEFISCPSRVLSHRDKPIQSQVRKSQKIMHGNPRSSNRASSTDQGDVRVRCTSIDWRCCLP